MNEFEIVERTFERYLQEIRSLLADCYSAKELCFDRHISNIIKTQRPAVMANTDATRKSCIFKE